MAKRREQNPRRILAGLGLVVTVVGFVTAARVVGVFVDGAAAETVFKLKAEIVLLALSTLGILIELGRRRHLTRGPRGEVGGTDAGALNVGLVRRAR